MIKQKIRICYEIKVYDLGKDYAANPLSYKSRHIIYQGLNISLPPDFDNQPFCKKRHSI